MCDKRSLYATISEHNFYVSELNIGFVDIEDFLCEATLTRGFDHPNVLKIIGVAIDKRNCFMVLPFMENGSLRDFLLDTQNVSLFLILYYITNR